MVAAFGILLIIVGAVFYKPDKRSTYSGVVHLVILSLGTVMILSGSAWLWYGIDNL